MPSLIEIANDPFLMILLKGDPDCGKTRFFSFFPKPILILDFDGKLHSMVKVYRERGISLEGVKAPFYGRSDIWTFDKKLDELMESRGEEYGTVIIDSLTSVATNAISYFSKNAPPWKPKQGKEDKAPKIIGGIKLPGWDEYGGEMIVLNSILQVMANLKCHRIVTSHIVAADKAEWQRQIITAGKKPAAMFPALFPEIYHLEARVINLDPDADRQYVFKTRSTGSDFARTTLTIRAEVEWTNKDPFDILCKAAMRDNRKLYRGKENEKENKEERKEDRQDTIGENN